MATYHLWKARYRSFLIVLLALPPEIDFKGTMIMARIPVQVPDDFNMYDYMS